MTTRDLALPSDHVVSAGETGSPGSAATAVRPSEETSTIDVTASSERSTTSHAVRFALVGVASTLLYTALFMVLDTHMNHNVANVVALVVCTVLNTRVNQRFTFSAGDASGRAAHVQSLAILAITVAVTTLALWIEHRIWPGAGTLLDTVTVTVGNAIATTVRFFTFRRIFVR